MNSKLGKLIVSLVVVAFLSLGICNAIIAASNSDYATCYDLYWSGKTARWSVSGWATKYRVTLYRDGCKVCTRQTNYRHYNFVGQMARGDHNYFFVVTAFNDIAGWGPEAQSDTVYVRYVEPTPYTPTPVPTPVPYTPTPVPAPYNPTPVPSPAPGQSTVPDPQIVSQPAGKISVDGSWKQVDGKYGFVYPNGVYATNTWLQHNSKWYYLDFNGIMVTGLYTINGKTYYLNPDGSMATGTIVYNGITHFFDNNGVMVY